ncbi:MAG TPA: hypothetical protein DCR40_00870 [Prolixibacteraceae bacterium]|nr:hypothetical protein [Prolixibacteraceae bacterium]
MSESIYEKIENRISTLDNIIFGFSSNGKDVVYTLNDYVQFFGGIKISNESQSYIIEFDQFISENPVRHKIYLNTFLKKYIDLDSYFEQLLDWPINEIVKCDIKLKSQCIKEIIEYLKGTLNPENIFVPIFNEDIIEDLSVKLGCYFAPKEQFMNFLKGKQIEGKINFMGNQNQLAGIFILSKEYTYVTLGTHPETFYFIKQAFLIKGKPIVTKQILSYLIEPGSIDKFGNLKDETKPGKANRKKFIDISI